MQIQLKQYLTTGLSGNDGQDLAHRLLGALANSDEHYFLDFSGLHDIPSPFLQQLLTPLAQQYGPEYVKQRINPINMDEQTASAYTDALALQNHEIENAHETLPFGDLSDITLDVLFKAREMARQDPSSAQLLFGVDSTMVKVLARMSFDQIKRASSAGIFCFQLRFTPEFATRLSALDASGVDVFLNVVGDYNLEGVYARQYT